MDKHSENENNSEIIAVYEQMRQKLLTEMRTDPTRFSETYVRACIKAGIITSEQMVSEGLGTYNTFDKFACNREILPDLEQYTARPDFVAKEDCTNIFFGIPASGKTCLLMGLTKAEGFCRRTKHINYATDFVPMVYPFSLGRCFEHGTFEYDNRSSLAIIDALRHMTAAKKESNFWDNLRDCLLKPLQIA
jgi:hypothetical protein